MQKKIKFVFDLDGTITKEETLPIIAEKFSVAHKINKLTEETVAGEVPFIESFIKRVHILGDLPVDEVSRCLSKVNLHPLVVDFIQKNKEHCVIATGNLQCWVEDLVRKVGCLLYCSEATIAQNRVVKLKKILRKESVVSSFQRQGYYVIFIGDGNNDLEAMRSADVSIASALTHWPAKTIFSVSDYLVCNEDALCRLLNQLS